MKRKLLLPLGTIEDPNAVRCRTEPHEEYDEGILTVYEPVIRLRRASTRKFAVEIVRVRTSWDGRGEEWEVSYLVKLDCALGVDVQHRPDKVGPQEYAELSALLRDAWNYVKRLERQEREKD
jgi:hypothetical protein